MKKLSEIFSKELISCIFLLIVAFFLRLYMFSISDNIWGADPDERLRIAAKWLSLSMPRPLFISDLWLPLHLYFLALIIKIFNNLTIAPRIMHVLIGCISLVPFYRLVKLIFNKKVAFYSALLFIFYPLHIICSIVTLSEILFLLFLIAFIYYYFKYIETNENIFFSTAILSFILSSMVRYEGWILIPIITLHLILSGRNKNALMFFASTALFPAILVFNMKMPVIYAQYHIIRNKRFIQNISIDWYWIEVLIKYFSLPLISAGLLGIFLSFRNKKAVSLLIVPVSLFLFFTYGISTHILVKNDEFALSFSVFLIPFIMLGLFWIFDKINFFKKEFMLTTVSIVLLFFISTSFGLIRKYPDYLNQIAIYFKHNLGKNDKVLLYNYNVQLNHIPIIAGFPIERFAIANGGGDAFLQTQESINDYVNKNKPRFIVCSEEDRTPAPFSNKNILLNNIMKSGHYILYEVIYNDI